ncbi:calcium uniporter protein 4, mitochondrial [Malania oleifera]|uniref:calcium uniporter protein 4, mitochondrial n=1 Tax=Malania oleifera TaxID=397392 RepID=UPI0025AEA4F4|nr:calcium uniporter protein 4, mitochondrial [Malania oleifera]
MALRKKLAQRLFGISGDSSPFIVLEHSPISSPSFQSLGPPNVARTKFHREFLTAPDSVHNGFFRRFLQRRGINQSARLPESLSLQVCDRLMEKLRTVNGVTGDRLWLEGLSPPTPENYSHDGISVQDAKKILRIARLEQLKSRLRQIPRNSIPHSEFIQICGEGCSNRDQGAEVAKMLDESGNVIVLGNIVFLRPEQVAKSMEAIISETSAGPNDPRRKELEELEKQKATIDERARAQVRGELYCGLGFLVAQTLGFMRLTFWELSWDVMEPICFFVTSLHFALGYAFFLRTSSEPSFEGYFQRRFKAKQKRLMEAQNFDVERYKELRKAFCPSFPSSDNHFSCFSRVEGGGVVF